MKTINCEICGITPLLIHRFGENAEQAGPSRPQLTASKTPREAAQEVVYQAKDGSYFFNAASITGAMSNAGANHKMRGSRKSLRFVVPAACRVNSDTITILNGDGPAKTFEVDSRPVTIPSTKGRIMRHRPRFDQWSAKFDLVVNEKLLPVELAQQLLEEAGLSVGVGDFRPERRGPFGTFRITRFEEVSQ